MTNLQQWYPEDREKSGIIHGGGVAREFEQCRPGSGGVGNEIMEALPPFEKNCAFEAPETDKKKVSKSKVIDT
ncbi:MULTISPECIES: hypothetical protein [Thermobacillus]|jgi:hypothetical protein|uniref:hypothetical protein n=1 Tax=Thermobacillus TaxID=76632 RepID=UPI001BCC8564|nr:MULTISPECIES: hypothetical protein [Thermobacillus]